MKFLDRQREMGRLTSFAESDAGVLALLWGRRRVGKTRLLLEWGRRVGALYTVADESSGQVQRRYIAEAVASTLEGFADPEYRDWRSLLRALARQAQQAAWKGPLVIDEFPYLAASDPALPSILQSFVDHEARQAGLRILLAGSSQRMMQGLHLDRSSPLYGRASEALELEPLPAGFIGEGLGIKDAAQCVRSWTAWGGIARYWELAAPFGADIEEAVDALVLDPNGPLHLEADRLLIEEFPPATALRPVLDAAGSGVHRLSEIAGRLGTSATSLGRSLGRLQELGLLMREQPYGELERSGKRSLYKILDPFTRMWFRVVAPHRAFLASATKAARLSLWRRHFGPLVAAAWEDLCRASISRLPAIVSDDGQAWGPARRYWRGSGPEWDIVAGPLDARSLLLGEVKWSDRPVSDTELTGISRELLAKGIPQEGWAAGRQPVHIIFVPELSQPRRRQPGSAVRVVTAREVLAALR